MAWTFDPLTGWSYASTRTARELGYHEGGHAVVQHDIGYKVISIYIRPGATSDAGATSCDPEVYPSPPQMTSYANLKNWVVSFGAICVAGAVGEYIDAGGGQPLPAFPSCLQWDDCMKAKGHFDRFAAQEQGWNEHHETSYSTTFDDFLKEACDYAFAALTRRRADLDAVANALVLKNQLGVADCAALLP